MTRAHTKLPVADVETAIKKFRGNITRVADHFGVKRSVMYLKLRAKPTLAQAMHDEREARKDRIEMGMDEAIDRGERWALALGVTLLCADRGWKLPKNNGSGVFGDGEDKLDSITIRSVNVTSYEPGTFAPKGTPIVQISALAPPPEPDDDGIITIEGELAEPPDDGEPGAEAPDEPDPEPPTLAPLSAEQAEAEYRAAHETDPMPAPSPAPEVARLAETKSQAAKWAQTRVTQRLAPQPDPTPEEPDPGVIAPRRRERLPRSPGEAAGVDRWLWDR